MRTETRTLYTLTELQDANPDAYAKVHEKWKESDGDIPWTEETWASMEATVKAFGGKIRNHRIQAGESGSHMTVEVEDTIESDDGAEAPKDAKWARDNVLAKLGYTVDEYPLRADGGRQFPGLCPFTGYCADEDFVQEVYNAMVRGESLKDALQGLAVVCAHLMQDNLEQWEDEESMLANWGDREFDIDGRPAKC